MTIKTQSAEDFKRRSSVEIGNPGIKRTLNKFTPFQALVEFIWNGFDAGATIVDINYERDAINHVSELLVIDNGSGIPYGELDKKFRPFLHSNKPIDPTLMYEGPSSVHGKNGQGRLTFFKFATAAEWDTVYADEQARHWNYTIRVDSNDLRNYQDGSVLETTRSCGTSVRFINISGLLEGGDSELTEYLVSAFAWFLELRSPYARTIRINGKQLNWTAYIADKESLTRTIRGVEFHVDYRRWVGRLHREYSRFYFIDSNDQEKSKKTTSFNNKGDDYYHSVYIRSTYFDSCEMIESVLDDDLENSQLSIEFSEVKPTDVVKELLSDLNSYLRKKRRPFLRQRALKFVSKLEEDKAFPKFTADPWDQLRKQELEEIMREVYEVEPRIFNGLSKQQAQTMVQLFSLAMNSSERESLLDIISQVVNLESEDRDNLAAILKTTHLSNVISTIRLISDRFAAVAELKSLVFEKDFAANERDHLQTHIERHYWLFGEQFHLVTSAEQKFEEAMRRFTYILRGQKTNRKINHVHKKKEMDVFAVRCLHEIDEINSMVVELKHPDLILGEEEVSQVKRYMSVIIKQPEFNGSNMTWEFYLVGSKLDDYVLGEISSHKSLGERNLIHINHEPVYKIYVLRWSEVLTNFELRHDFILKKLELEREKLGGAHRDADEILANGHLNSASLNGSIARLS